MPPPWRFGLSRRRLYLLKRRQLCPYRPDYRGGLFVFLVSIIDYVDSRGLPVSGARLCAFGSRGRLAIEERHTHNIVSLNERCLNWRVAFRFLRIHIYHNMINGNCI
jgi:hypothetical protein